MNSNPQPTPGPWYVENHWITDSTGLVTIAAMPIVQISESNEVKPGELDNPANAALIVTAVNSHAALLAACKAALACLTMDSDSEEDYAPEIKKLRSAIALAQEGK